MTIVWKVGDQRDDKVCLRNLRVEDLRICGIERDRAGVFRPEASFRALSRVWHAKLRQRKRLHESLTVHTDYGLDARICEDLGSWPGNVAGSKEQC